MKVAWKCISKFDVHLINKQFLLQTDASALQKVLTKDIKKPREAKFAKWQALSSNFDFQVEHITGTKSYLPYFLSREFIQPQEHIMVIVTEWDQSQKHEVLCTILDNQDWEEYRDKWKPTWQLINTKVLDANLHAHTDI